MARYFQKDLLIFDDGELDLSGGDIGVAGDKQAQRQLAINILNTTRGGYKADPTVGWGGEQYIGKPNNPMTHQQMRQDIGVALADVEDLAKEDLDYHVAFIAEEECAVIVRHSGIFLRSGGAIFLRNGGAISIHIDHRDNCTYCNYLILFE